MGQQRNTTEKQITTAVAPIPAATIEKVLMQGDLSGLTPEERLHYYKSVCETLHLNPLTKPFDYIILDQKLVLYATKDCAAQLRKRNKISIAITSREQQDTIYVVTAKASLHTTSSVDPREDESLGAVSIISRDGIHLKGTALANAIMKAETKAKRRVTLSVCGLGMLDEGELEADTSPPNGDSSAIVERNVKEATAHVTGEGGLEPVTVESAKYPIAGTEDVPKNDFGPLNITESNYKELKSHVGKAQGNMLGYRVGDLHRNVIEWMHKNWLPDLKPSASDQDLRLAKAIKLAYDNKDGIASDTNGVSGGAVNAGGASAPAQAQDIGARAACINDLRQRIEDLVLTEEQACGYLHKFGLFGQGWTSFNDAPDNLLLHLSTPQGWKTFKELYEAEVKPKVVEKAVKKPRATRRRR